MLGWTLRLDEQADDVGGDGKREAARHQHRAEIHVVVEEAAAIETGTQDADQAQDRDDDSSPYSRKNRRDKHQQDEQGQEESQRGVYLQPNEAAFGHRPIHTPYNTSEVLGRLGPRMVGGNIDEQVESHAEQELHDEEKERSPEQRALQPPARPGRGSRYRLGVRHDGGIVRGDGLNVKRSRPAVTPLALVLVLEMRQLGADITRMEQAVSATLGLNTTDLHCLEILDRMGPLAASQLATEAGLSRGALTTAIDRLERGGFARRQDDPTDGRRVLISLADRARWQEGAFAALVSESLALHAGYSDDQLELLVDFIRNTRDLLAAHGERARRQVAQDPTPRTRRSSR
ncbi:MAG: MarR family winged helix-turn-helix transcriptional regulator [Candidatus Dormibacteraceae bacterium]